MMIQIRRAFIYARFSTDNQSSASVPDQIRRCREICAQEGWQVVGVFADEAMSGFKEQRPEFQKMRDLAYAGGCDVIVAEGYERLARDAEHSAAFFKRLNFRGIPIYTKQEGWINEMHVGLSTTLSAMALKQISEKTRRGLEGRVLAGKSAGGICYGYKIDRQPLPDGTFTTGDRLILENEAAVVQRIFRDYDRGLSARSIAMALNKEGIPPPRGGEGSTWSFSTISGNWKRGTGILNNELYIGRLVWNRQKFVTDPDTGKRQARPNPPGAWVTEEVPHLRIIEDDLWERVKRRQGAIREEIFAERDASPDAPKMEVGRRAKYLFSGLLSCGCCGAGYIMISDSRYGCSAARNRGSCENRKTIARKEVEARVLEGLKEKLMHPELIATFSAEFQAASQKERAEQLAAKAQAERQLGKVSKEIENIVSAIAQGMFHASMKAKMDGLEAERAKLEAELAALPEVEPVAIHPGLAEVYSRKVANLVAALNAEGSMSEAAEILRGLIEKVVLHPDLDAPNGHAIELFGELGAILSLCEDGLSPSGPKMQRARRGSAGIVQVTVVAGAGFEPAAFRL